MKTYRVVARVSGIVFADIEADNEKEALEIARAEASEIDWKEEEWLETPEPSSVEEL